MLHVLWYFDLNPFGFVIVEVWTYIEKVERYRIIRTFRAFDHDTWYHVFSLIPALGKLDGRKRSTPSSLGYESPANGRKRDSSRTHWDQFKVIAWMNRNFNIVESRDYAGTFRLSYIDVFVEIKMYLTYSK